VIPSLAGAFIGATSVLVASVALGARWEGSESVRRLAEAKREALAELRHPVSVRAAFLRACLATIQAVDTPVRKRLEAVEQLVSRAENQAEFRKTRNKAHHELLGDFERDIDTLLRLNQPKGVRGALKRAREGAARPFRRDHAPDSTRRPSRGTRT
jgi:hypothetical protein